MRGVGIDLLEIERLERALARRPRLVERFFTEGERTYAERRPRPAQHLAARFCAKEAVAKALGVKVTRWREIEVVGKGGPPEVRLHGTTAAEARGPVRVSLTHTRGMAGAVAVVE